MTIGETVRAERKRLGLTQEALARRADMSKSGVQLIEHGQRTDLPYSSLKKLSGALGLTIGELVGETTAPGKAQAPSPPETGAAETGLSDKEASIFDVVHEAILEQDKENFQAIARADESGQPQVSYVRHENAALSYLQERPRGDVEESYIDLMRSHVGLEQENVRLKEELTRVHANASELP